MKIPTVYYTHSLIFIFSFLLVTTVFSQAVITNNLVLNDSAYFEKRGLNVLVFSNWYNGNFGDSKISGIEIIHHGVRTVTNGDVRLNPTPDQWDPIPSFEKRVVNKENKTIEAYLGYPAYQFRYMIKAEPKNGGLRITVNLEKPLPQQLEGRAGFNLEFLPSAYFRKSYLMDDQSGIFPLYPNSEMQVNQLGNTEPLPIATGTKLTLAPEDPTQRVSISTKEGNLQLLDGRNKAQNGWYVVRTLIPSNKTGTVIEWFISANTIADWTRQPVITYSQVGYHPLQKKVAVIELDKNDHALVTAKLLKVGADGKMTEKFTGPVNNWGNYLRYHYVNFDFSAVKEPGLYVIEYGHLRTQPFPIATNVYENAWHSTMDVYFPIAMDHVFVKEAYRVWHGASHLDDALQAPINHEHFDLYAQGPSTNSPYKPLEHIPGLNVGGWYDAGDFDIRTQTIYTVVSTMVQTWETFGLKRDETSIDQKRRYVTMHSPDGKPDILQQIEHGTLQLLAQYKAVGHAINGIVEAHLSQYTHLGDAVNKTDNLIYNPKLDTLQSDGFTSGTFDDRWAFTSKSTPLNYGSIAALTAASRALKGYNDTLSDQCLATAKKVWEEEHSHTPDLFHHGNTTGGSLVEEELKAAVELLITTKDDKYAKRINELWPTIENKFSHNAAYAVRAIPFMDAAYSKKLEPLVKIYQQEMDDYYKKNPFGLYIETGGWAGNGQIITMASTNYILHKAFPNLVNTESVFRGLNYIFGCHPGSNISFVSGVGAVSKEVAYGNNRADFTFIAGGVVPGELILAPDFPENKEDWPFLWGENEYVVNVGASYVFLVNAVNELLNGK
jgi:endoglucanase